MVGIEGRNYLGKRMVFFLSISEEEGRIELGGEGSRRRSIDADIWSWTDEILHETFVWPSNIWLSCYWVFFVERTQRLANINFVSMLLPWYWIRMLEFARRLYQRGLAMYLIRSKCSKSNNVITLDNPERLFKCTKGQNNRRIIWHTHHGNRLVKNPR